MKPSPAFPGRGAGRPQLLKVNSIAERIHRLEEAFMAECLQFPFRGQLLQWLLLPNGLIVADILADIPRQHEEAAIYETAFALRLFKKARDALSLHLQHPEAFGRIDRGDSGLSAVFPMKFNRCCDIEVCDAVSISQAEPSPVIHLDTRATLPPVCVARVDKGRHASAS